MSTLLLQHVGGCPRRLTGHSDAAKRIADTLNQAWVSLGWDATKYWVAFELGEGRWDWTFYDSKRDAVRHQSDEYKCLYIKIHPGGSNACETEAILEFTRRAYLKGFRLPDPDKKSGGADLIPRIGMDKISAQIRALTGR